MVYNPKNMYQQYNEAFEKSTTSVIKGYRSNQNYINKEMRKDKTFYYDGAQHNIVFDKVIDKLSPVIGIQYVLGLTVVYAEQKQ